MPSQTMVPKNALAGIMTEKARAKLPEKKKEERLSKLELKREILQMCTDALGEWEPHGSLRPTNLNKKKQINCARGSLRFALKILKTLEFKSGT